ncbi:hypothetical protein K2X33_15325 [bacterium]|nr:hypothetical protein [bacterium]
MSAKPFFLWYTFFFLSFSALPGFAEVPVGGSQINAVVAGADPTGKKACSFELQQAANEAATKNVPTTLYIPAGWYKLDKPLTVRTSVVMDPDARLVATAPMPVLLQIGSEGAPVKNGTVSGGILDAANLADTGLVVAAAENITLRDITVWDSRIAFRIGYAGRKAPYGVRTSGLVSDRRQRMIETAKGEWVADRATSIPPYSYGLLVDNATDGKYTLSVFKGVQTGVRTNSSGDFYSELHVWTHFQGGHGYTDVAFEDRGHDNTWIGCMADSVAKAGFLLVGDRTNIIGSRIYNYGPKEGDQFKSPTQAVAFELAHLDMKVSILGATIHTGNPAFPIKGTLRVPGGNPDRAPNLTVTGIFNDSVTYPYSGNTVISPEDHNLLNGMRYENR